MASFGLGSRFSCLVERCWACWVNQFVGSCRTHSVLCWAVCRQHGRVSRWTWKFFLAGWIIVRYYLSSIISVEWGRCVCLFEVCSTWFLVILVWYAVCGRARGWVGGWVGVCRWKTCKSLQQNCGPLWEVWSQEHHPNIQVSRWLTYFVDIVDITM